jgi:CRISPR-associated protein Csm4
MKAFIIDCPSGSSFHFGKYAPDLNTALSDSSEICHSDTLFSAMVVTYLKLFGNVDEFIQIVNNGEVTFSSVFHCFENNGDYIYFLPKPLSFNNIQDKKIKKIKYLSDGVWQSIHNAQELLNDEIVILQNKFAVLRSELGNLSKFQTENLKVYNDIYQTKVHIHKQEKTGGLYEVHKIEMPDLTQLDLFFKTNLYFLFTESITNEDLKKRFYKMLALLAFDGIGGERSSGNMMLEYKIIEGLSLDHADSSSFTNLSLVSPTKDDLKEVVYSDYIIRGGRKTGIESLPLKIVSMISEGSIFTKKLIGTLIDISPDHSDTGRYLRCGKGFFLSIKQEWHDK